MKRLVLFALALSMLFALAGPAPLTAAKAADAGDYYIEVDVSSQVVTVYDAASHDIVRQMLCSTGQKVHWTPVGDYVLPKPESRDERGPWYQIGGYYVRYATRIVGQVLFHSIPYTRPSLDAIAPECAKRFGFPASHGCVRLRWKDAQFISDNCPPGTKVRILMSGERNEGLRELLFQNSYDASLGFSYECFLGMTDEPGALGRYSEGSDVLDLQYRLRDLGLYNGEFSGVYDSATVNAVRAAQYLLGEEVTGAATVALRQRLFSDEAPTAMDVELKTGMSGPAVRRLQENLATLRLYQGALDSVYDGDVVEAVKQFQRAYCYEQDGVAAPEVQKAADYEAKKLAASFAEEDYSCQWTNDPVKLVRAEAEAGVRLRERASQDSRQLQRLSMGQLAVVLEQGKSWTKVRLGSDEGYVKNDFVSFHDREAAVLKYTGAANGATYIVGNSAADYYTGAQLPCQAFEDYLAATEMGAGDLVNYATVDTRGEGVGLNLRQTPDTAGVILATVEDGKSLRVQRRGNDWTRVSYEGREGYLLNRYLNFWTGTEDALEADAAGEAADLSQVRYATVRSGVNGKAGVYDEDSEDARLLGHLADGIQLDVVEIVGGWCRIRYKGHEGYMMAEDLELAFENAPESTATIPSL